MSDTNGAKGGVRNKVGNFLTRRPKSLLSKILIALLIVLPLAGSAVYMWSMWDPTVYLNNVPIGVANADKGAIDGGEEANFGTDVVEGLKAEPYLNIIETTPEEALEGLRTDKYLFIMTIPEDFSENILTVIDPEPQQAKITFTMNDYNGSAGAFLTSALIPIVAGQVSGEIGAEYASEVLVGLNMLKDGLIEVQDGAVQLDDGAGQIQDGAWQLADGMDQIMAGTDELADGMEQISGGVDMLVDLLVPILEQVSNIAPVLQPIADTLARSSNPEMQENAATIQGIIDTFSEDNPEYIVGQLGELKDGARLVHHMLADDEAEYRDGLNQIHAGTHELVEGSDELKAGTEELYAGVTAGIEEAPTVEDIAKSSQQVANPFITKEIVENPSQVEVGDITEKEPAEGTSLAFVVVFGFLFMAILSMLLPVAMGRRYDSDAKNAFLPVLKAGGLSAVVGIVVVGLFAVLASTVLGWEPADGGAMAGILITIGIMAGVAYMFYRTLFGRLVGGIASLAVFMMGVFSYGGVWPLSTTPGAFKWIHPLSPMSYARDAFTLGTEGIYNGTFWTGIVVLLVMAVAAVILTGIIRYFQLGATTPEALEAKAEAAVDDKAEPVTA
ncbi:MAG: YhgE/Pip family protein [Lawsonella sp.]